jgi:hypothetical protein
MSQGFPVRHRARGHRHLLAMSPDPNSAIQSYNKFAEYAPKSYDWKFNSDYSLKNKLSDAASARDANRILWWDILHSIQACKMIFLNRSNSALLSLSDSINRADYLASAVLARALLEICMWHIHYSHIFENTMSKLEISESVMYVNPGELGELVNKVIFGTNVNATEELKQSKVKEVLIHTAKATGDQFRLERSYDILCEFTHPNVGGNNLFVDFDINGNQKPRAEITIQICEHQRLKDSDGLSSAILTCIEFCWAATWKAAESYQAAAQVIAVNQTGFTGEQKARKVSYDQRKLREPFFDRGPCARGAHGPGERSGLQIAVAVLCLHRGEVRMQ